MSIAPIWTIFGTNESSWHDLFLTKNRMKRTKSFRKIRNKNLFFFDFLFFGRMLCSLCYRPCFICLGKRCLESRSIFILHGQIKCCTCLQNFQHYTRVQSQSIKHSIVTTGLNTSSHKHFTPKFFFSVLAGGRCPSDPQDFGWRGQSLPRPPLNDRT